jgi:hypothetical protein
LVNAAAIAQNQQGAGRGIPMALAACALLVVAWYVLRALALRWTWAESAVHRISPRTRRMHEWIVSAPATFGYIAVFTATTVVQRTTPPRLINLLTSVNSTSLAQLRLAPLSALADSAVWVADRGAGLGGYIVGFATLVAWAERRYGTPRIILICLAGHVLGTLLTARVELHAIQTGLAPAKLATSTDVGVSYIMVAGIAAAVLVMQRRWQLICGIGLAAGVIAPVFISHTVWDLGHLLATLCGLAAAALTLLAAPPRPAPLVLLLTAADLAEASRSQPSAEGGPARARRSGRSAAGRLRRALPWQRSAAGGPGRAPPSQRSGGPGQPPPSQRSAAGGPGEVPSQRPAASGPQRARQPERSADDRLQHERSRHSES